MRLVNSDPLHADTPTRRHADTPLHPDTPPHAGTSLHADTLPLTSRIIAASARNPLLVILLTLIGIAGGVYALFHTPLDAIPDLSDVQVIVYTDWPGRSPDLIEDQITYPITTK